jgi:hypothetical protein
LVPPCTECPKNKYTVLPYTGCPKITCLVLPCTECPKIKYPVHPYTRFRKMNAYFFHEPDVLKAHSSSMYRDP